MGLERHHIRNLAADAELQDGFGRDLDVQQGLGDKREFLEGNIALHSGKHAIHCNRLGLTT